MGGRVERPDPQETPGSSLEISSAYPSSYSLTPPVPCQPLPILSLSLPLQTPVPTHLTTHPSHPVVTDNTILQRHRACAPTQGCDSFLVTMSCLSSRVLTVGPLMGGPQCRVSNLRNVHVACPSAMHVPCCL